MNQILHVQLTINNVPKHKNIYIFSIINYYKNTKLRHFVGDITDYHPIKLSGFKLQLCWNIYPKIYTEGNKCNWLSVCLWTIYCYCKNCGKITKFRTPTYGKLRQIYLAQLCTTLYVSVFWLFHPKITDTFVRYKIFLTEFT